MNKQTEEALRMAIEAMENAQDMIGDGGSSIPNYFETQINACKAALESQESEQEPVAWMNDDGLMGLYKHSDTAIPLYTKPTKVEVNSTQQNTFVRLSDDEIALLWANNAVPLVGKDYLKITRAIEDKLMEINK